MNNKIMNGKRMNNSSPFRWNSKSNHFINDRFDGIRTPYNNEDELFEDLLSRKDELIFLTSNPKELQPYPLLRNKYKKYPHSNYWVCESLNLAVVIVDGTIITLLNLY
jgi:hypothetical protein